MLEGIFGNKTAEKVLLYILHYEQAYGEAISKDMGLSRHAVLNQLDRFEMAGVLISQEFGRTRVYRFNLKSPRTKPVRDLIEQIYEAIPLRERELLFKIRRRPRQKNKPVLGGSHGS